jgi:hypothetical protein
MRHEQNVAKMKKTFGLEDINFIVFLKLDYYKKQTYTYQQISVMAHVHMSTWRCEFGKNV